MNTIVEISSKGFLGTVHLELAELARHEGRADDARRHAEAVLSQLAGEPGTTLAVETETRLESLPGS